MLDWQSGNEDALGHKADTRAPRAAGHRHAAHTHAYLRLLQTSFFYFNPFMTVRANSLVFD